MGNLVIDLVFFTIKAEKFDKSISYTLRTAVLLDKDQRIVVLFLSRLDVIGVF